jgi:hypothetical protein
MLLLIASHIMPRTTLDIDTAVLRELRRRGELEHKSMGQLASELLARALADSKQSAAPPDFSWRTGDLGAPLVDLEDKEALRRVLDQRR